MRKAGVTFIIIPYHSSKIKRRLMMERQSGLYLIGTEHLSPEERYRERRARQICEQVSKEVDFDLDSLGQANACVQFVYGHMDEAELWERARKEMEQGARL
jgi:hypothetical protein